MDITAWLFIYLYCIPSSLISKHNFIKFQGHDTTSAAMNFFLHLMGTHPEIQTRVHREIDDIIGDTPRDLTFDDIGRLKYLEACLKETLRLYPSVPLIARQVTDEVKVRKYPSFTLKTSF